MRGMTVVDEKLEQMEMRTVPGMAHWAGTGPEGAFCSNCNHYGYEYFTSKGRLMRRLSACGKFYAMTETHGDTLPSKTDACKYFSPLSAR